jgi:heptosyltransferase-2
VQTVKKILVRGPNWVGDAVLAVPAMKVVREGFPGAEITALVRPWVAGVFKGAAFVDHIWAVPKPAGVSGWGQLAREIRQRQYDLAILLPNSFESALTAFLGGVPQRVGYAGDGRRWLLTAPLERPLPAPHQTEYYLALARAVTRGVSTASIEIRATADERAAARELLESAGIPQGTRFMVLSPGAAFGTAKRWDADRFASAGAALSAEFKCGVAIVGSPSEQGVAAEVASHLSQPVADLCGKTTLETLIGVISESMLVVANDSGPMHIAAALGVPTVGVFGSTDVTVTAPVGPRARVVRHPVECSPCMLRDCPIDRRCMTRVTVEDVCRAGRDAVAGHA